MDFNQLTDLDRYIFLCYTSGYTYSEIQEKIHKEMGIDLGGRKLSYRVDTLRKKFDCATQLQLGYKYAVEATKLERLDLKYQIKKTKKESKEKVLVIGSVIWLITWLITYLLIWYFQMWH
jgi:hypothetical protein